MNIVFGSSGHAKEIYWLIQSIAPTPIDYFVSLDNVGEYICGVCIISEDDFGKISPQNIDNVYLGIGSGLIRKKIYNKLAKLGYQKSQFPTLLHPNIVYDSSPGKVNIGIGGVVCSSVILTTEINIGDFVHINIKSTVSHESSVGDFSTISPSCCVCGNVNIGRNVFLGANSTIIDGLNICDDALIGAGAVVIRNVEVAGTYCGVPAKKLA